MADTLVLGPGGNARKGIGMEEIVSVMRQRRSQDTYLIRAMIDVRDRYNGDIIIPLPDVVGQPKLQPPIAQLLAIAIDNLARKASEVRPRVTVPNMVPGSKVAAKHSENTRRAIQANWEYNQLWDLKLARSYRHMWGYGTNAFMVMPEFRDGRARIEIRDPLTAYPELRVQDDVRPAENCGFIFGRSMDWLVSHYPQTKTYFSNSSGHQWDTIWDVVEWVDSEMIVMGIMGPRNPAYMASDSRPYAYSAFELGRWENKAGMCTAVVPRRLTLDRIQSALTPLIGTYDLVSRIASLQLIAGEKSVFPDLAVIGRDPSTPPTIASHDGNWQDGRTGEANILQNVASVQFLESRASPETQQLMEQLMNVIQTSGGASSLFQGENPDSLRTGRAISTMSSFSIDPLINEVQKIQQRALESVNTAMLEVELGYFGSRKIVGFTGLAGDRGVVEYVPKEDFISTLNHVSYAIPGADISQMSVADLLSSN